MPRLKREAAASSGFWRSCCRAAGKGRAEGGGEPARVDAATGRAVAPAATEDGAEEPTLGETCDGTDDDLCEGGAIQCRDGELVCTDSEESDAELCDGIDNVVMTVGFAIFTLLVEHADEVPML